LKTKYSYISPRQKRVISAEVGLLISFFGLIFIFIFAMLWYLSMKIDMYEDLKLSYSHQTEQIKYQTSLIEEEITVLQTNLDKATYLSKHNELLANSIANLLNLVPEKITLSKVELDEKKVTVYGVTPSKDIYNLLMLAPLKAIFDSSYTNFYLEENGWYKFVSHNSMDNNLTIFRNK
jgi:hypothetical protein